MRSLVRILTLSMLPVLMGCGWRVSPQPSILVIAVEGLNSEVLTCGNVDPEFSDGIGQLCSDGVRFTHAYTPSVLSQAALASVLTGLYPQQTGVWHNGSQFLSEKHETAAELAIKKGYRTAFFSGGPPIWRKSGLAQGFEIFEDNIVLQPQQIYRPVARNFNLFLNWLAGSVGGDAFFSFIFLPDLQFPNSETINDLGQARAKNFEGQIKEFNESFVSLVNQLKRAKRWDNTHIVLAGLNGQTRATRTSEMDGTNLFSENAQVFLFIKPARKIRDATIDWTIDANVTLVDVGQTLREWLGAPIATVQAPFTTVSLIEALKKPQVSWDRERLILSESSWASWRGVGGTRVSLHQGSLLYLFDIKPMVFNGLVDPFEGQPISPTDATVRAAALHMRQQLLALEILPYEPLGVPIIEKIRLTKDLEDPLQNHDELKSRLSHLLRQRPWDKQILGWLARELIKDQDWAQLATLGKENLEPWWQYVAQKQLGQATNDLGDECGQLLTKQKNTARLCSDKEFIAFMDWVNSPKKTKQELEDKFVALYYRNEIDEAVSKYNFHNGLVWDAAVDLPGAPRLVQLILTLKEYKSAANTLQNRMRTFKKITPDD